jgi:hypothetical protein
MAHVHYKQDTIATNTHSGYVILIAFPLLNMPQSYVMYTLPVLFPYIFV